MEKITYAELYKRCPSAMLNNEAFGGLLNRCDLYPEVFCGSEIEEHEPEEFDSMEEYEEYLENPDYIEFGQFFIVDYDDAMYLKEHTFETVYYFEEIDMYFWAVEFFNTSWEMVSANIK